MEDKIKVYLDALSAQRRKLCLIFVGDDERYIKELEIYTDMVTKYDETLKQSDLIPSDQTESKHTEGMWIGGWYNRAYLTKQDLEDMDDGKLSLEDAYQRCFEPSRRTIADKVLVPPVKWITNHVNNLKNEYIEYNRRGKK